MPPRKQVVPQTFEKEQWVAVATDVRNYQFCLLSDCDLSNAQAFKKGKSKWTLSTDVPNHQFLHDNWDYSELECLIIQQKHSKSKG